LAELDFGVGAVDADGCAPAYSGAGLRDAEKMLRHDARPALEELLRERPSKDVVESVSAIADEEGMVLLGRLARTTPALADAALDALESIDHPRASAIAARIRHLPRSSVGPG
jgi:hypothetical protein